VPDGEVESGPAPGPIEVGAAQHWRRLPVSWPHQEQQWLRSPVASAVVAVEHPRAVIAANPPVLAVVAAEHRVPSSAADGEEQL